MEDGVGEVEGLLGVLDVGDVDEGMLVGFGFGGGDALFAEIVDHLGWHLCKNFISYCSIIIGTAVVKVDKFHVRRITFHLR